MGVWQVAAGSIGRDYIDRFLRHGMAFVGGDTPCSAMDEQVRLGDKIILKRGMSQIVAVGRVVERNGKFKGNGDKEWLRDWMAGTYPAWCYVDWCKPSEPIQTNGLTRPTIQGVNQAHLLALAEEALNSNPPEKTYEAEPPDTKKVADETLISELVQLGLRPGAAEELTKHSPYPPSGAILSGSRMEPDE